MASSPRRSVPGIRALLAEVQAACEARGWTFDQEFKAAAQSHIETTAEELSKQLGITVPGVMATYSHLFRGQGEKLAEGIKAHLLARDHEAVDNIEKLEARIEEVAKQRASAREEGDDRWKSRKTNGGDIGVKFTNQAGQLAFLHRGLVEAWEIMTDKKWPGEVERLALEEFPDVN